MELKSTLHIQTIQESIIEMITNAASGHPGGSLSAADILNVLFFDIMDLSEKNVNSINRDRFVLSKGHAAPALYATLAEKGIIEKSELFTLRQINSRLQGHPNMNDLPGIDMSTGSLGQGISAAVGMAIANKLDHVDHRIYVLLGDGECEEGQVWEAAMAAAHYKLDNLIAIVDFNGLQIDGNIQEVMNPTPIDNKFKAFGWHIIHVEGHNHQQLYQAFEEAKAIYNQPTMILAHTIKGHGVSFMENEASWHGTAPNKEQCKEAVLQIRQGE